MITEYKVKYYLVVYDLSKDAKDYIEVDKWDADYAIRRLNHSHPDWLYFYFNRVHTRQGGPGVRNFEVQSVSVKYWLNDSDEAGETDVILSKRKEKHFENLAPLSYSTLQLIKANIFIQYEYNGSLAEKLNFLLNDQEALTRFISDLAYDAFLCEERSKAVPELIAYYVLKFGKSRRVLVLGHLNLTLKDAGIRIGVSPSTISKHIKNGEPDYFAFK